MDGGQFLDKVVIVTGASSGIGQQVALTLADKGTKLTIQGRDQDRLNETLEQCRKASGKKGNITTVLGDVTETEVRKALVDKTIQTFGSLDILISCVGMAFPSSGIFDETEETFDIVMNSNLRSVFFLIQYATPYLEKTKGSIVVVSSVASLMPQPQNTVYAMAKNSLNHLVSCLAVELGPKGTFCSFIKISPSPLSVSVCIRINTTNPSATRTRALRTFDQALGMSDFSVMDMSLKMLASAHPLHGRCATVREQSDVIVFLASAQASFVTGQHIYVDGGICLHMGTPTPKME
ncbi:uncharacterized oxidoreductase TM_0325-like [Aplysia californica]|uniref:Uncharacterized oxidoreductase TM_0325-like n=1 Tax=Aplysia californica TaxID=6500 RepID=A0ABM0ZV04_APLCA|nr:uncharacterized oxidoreductase TM_0325-like [Aplysia californica]